MINHNAISKIVVCFITCFAILSLVGLISDINLKYQPHILIFMFGVVIALALVDRFTFDKLNVFILLALMFFVLFGTQTMKSLHSSKSLMLLTIACYVVVSDTRKKLFHDIVIIAAKTHFVFHLFQFGFLYNGSDLLVHSTQRIFYPLFLGFRAPGIFDEPSYAAGFYMLATASKFYQTDWRNDKSFPSDILLFLVGTILTFSTGAVLHLAFFLWYLFYRPWQILFFVIAAFSLILATIIGFSMNVDGGDAVRAKVIAEALQAFTSDPLNIFVGLGIGGVETMFKNHGIFGTTTNSGLIDLFLSLGLIGTICGVLFFFTRIDLRNKNNFFHVTFFVLPSLFSINYLQLVFWIYLCGLQGRNHEK